MVGVVVLVFRGPAAAGPEPAGELQASEPEAAATPQPSTPNMAAATEAYWRGLASAFDRASDFELPRDPRLGSSAAILMFQEFGRQAERLETDGVDPELVEAAGAYAKAARTMELVAPGLTDPVREFKFENAMTRLRMLVDLERPLEERYATELPTLIEIKN